jgi:hypothetical protein
MQSAKCKVDNEEKCARSGRIPFATLHSSYFILHCALGDLGVLGGPRDFR